MNPMFLGDAYSPWNQVRTAPMSDEIKIPEELFMDRDGLAEVDEEGIAQRVARWMRESSRRETLDLCAKWLERLGYCALADNLKMDFRGPAKELEISYPGQHQKNTVTGQ